MTTKKNDRTRMRNILINAVAVMLVYSSYYGGAAVMVCSPSQTLVRTFYADVQCILFEQL